MKLLALGDTHGVRIWEDIVTREKWDKVVFVGDYWDSYDIPFTRQWENFNKIVQFKQDHPEQVVLLLGNHDFHYLPLARQHGDCYSGFQEKNQFMIGHLLQTHLGLFQMAHQEENYLFSHAGVTKTWLNSTVGLGPENAVLLKNIGVAEYINDVWRYTPRLFLFTGNDPYGNDATQSPIWVRPESLNEDALQGYVQVVGHTRQGRIGVEPTDFLEGGSGFFIDCLDKGWYLSIEDGVATPCRINRGLPYWQRAAFESDDFVETDETE